MALDYDTLARLRKSHPGWKLLTARHAPLIASFLVEAFLRSNVREIAQPDLVEKLEDTLFTRREIDGPDSWPGSAMDYLTDWTAPERGWLRRFYRDGSDEPHFDLTPATEKALAWLEGLTTRGFVGTESRLLTLFDLLRQIAHGSDLDPVSRRAELEARRTEIDAEIAALDAGEMPVLDDTAVRDRFQQFSQTARELLSDFREVEDNFRTLDRETRERIALWDGAKGELLAHILDERDAISHTDQGRSFRAFWDFLMSSERQDEFTKLLPQVLALPAVRTLHPDQRLRRVHHDWLEAGEHAQRTVAVLSQQLRRFVDEQVWLENRRILDIIRSIETRALALRERPPEDAVTTLDGLRPSITLPMERTLHAPTQRLRLDSRIDVGDASDTDVAALFAGIVIDRESLVRHAQRELQSDGQVSLATLIQRQPLEHGLAELVTWLEVADTDFESTTIAQEQDTVTWPSADSPNLIREARLPRIVLTGTTHKSGVI